MFLFPPDKIEFNHEKSAEIKHVMESTFRLIMYSRSHLADDLLNSYLAQATSFQELLSIKNAQMEAQNEEEAREYARLLVDAVDFITSEIEHDINFTSEVQLFQLFRLISPDSHASHPNRYRHQMVQIGQYLCPAPEEVPGLVSELIHQMTTITNPIMRAIYFHHELIRIHPFADGNGRTVRMAKNWMLMFELFPPIFISEPEGKREYISTLSQSFDYLARQDTSWNEHLEAFFDQELNRLLRNATIIYESVSNARNLRKG